MARKPKDTRGPWWPKTDAETVQKISDVQAGKRVQRGGHVGGMSGQGTKGLEESRRRASDAFQNSPKIQIPGRRVKPRGRGR